jgi:hypothetical protein
MWRMKKVPYIGEWPSWCGIYPWSTTCSVYLETLRILSWCTSMHLMSVGCVMSSSNTLPMLDNGCIFKPHTWSFLMIRGIPCSRVPMWWNNILILIASIANGLSSLPSSSYMIVSESHELFIGHLISRSKQPTIEIDVFLEPLLKDMKNLWEEGSTCGLSIKGVLSC